MFYSLLTKYNKLRFFETKPKIPNSENANIIAPKMITIIVNGSTKFAEIMKLWNWLRFIYSVQSFYY